MPLAKMSPLKVAADPPVCEKAPFSVNVGVVIVTEVDADIDSVWQDIDTFGALSVIAVGDLTVIPEPLSCIY